jgi:hypothetical protein
MDFNDIVGKEIKSVGLYDGNDRIRFSFQDETERSYGVEGDCCSSSWIEHLEIPNDIEGAVILSVEDGGGVAWDNHDCDGHCGHDSLAVYNTKFYTSRGTITLEYRNDSNGYYGGYLTN